MAAKIMAAASARCCAFSPSARGASRRAARSAAISVGGQMAKWRQRRKKA